MGAQQVGKAAICGWEELLKPGLKDPALKLLIWPFHGSLADLLRPGQVIIAETYPAEYYADVLSNPHSSGGYTRFSKRNPLALQRCAANMLRWAISHDLELDPILLHAIESGFTPPSGGEDAFDATIGLFGMLSVILGTRPAGEPENEGIRRLEGWILGQPALN
jgi:hypothetical protein